VEKRKQIEEKYHYPFKVFNSGEIIALIDDR
jgi:hypothetical protein